MSVSKTYSKMIGRTPVVCKKQAFLKLFQSFFKILHHCVSYCKVNTFLTILLNTHDKVNTCQSTLIFQMKRCTGIFILLDICELSALSYCIWAPDGPMSCPKLVLCVLLATCLHVWSFYHLSCSFLVAGWYAGSRGMVHNSF